MSDQPKRQRVTIATPLRHYRGPKDLPKQIGRTLRELLAREDAKGYEFDFVAYGGGLCSARNAMVHDFLKEERDWLLPWDADLHHPKGREADAILRLLAWRQPIVGGLYCRRLPGRPRWCVNWLNGAKIQEGGILQVVELGGGFKLYGRSVFTELKRIFGDEPYADLNRRRNSILYRDRDSGEMMAGFYQIPVADGDLLSEDFYLDLLARCAQIPILADTQIRMQQRDDDGSIYPPKDWPPIPAEDSQ